MEGVSAVENRYMMVYRAMQRPVINPPEQIIDKDAYIPAAPMPVNISKSWYVGCGAEEGVQFGPNEIEKIAGTQDMASSPRSVVSFAQKQRSKAVEYNSKQARINDESCSYCVSGICSEIEARCGGRKQYAVGINNAESDIQKALPHNCRYHPKSVAGYVFIASDDKATQHDLVSICRTYLGISDDKIEVMTTKCSEEELRLNKQLDDDISLLISDSPMVIKKYKERNFVSHIYFFGDETALAGDTRLFYEKKLITDKGLNLSHIVSALTKKGFTPK